MREPPPSYSQSEPAAGSSPMPTFRSKPTNFLALSEKGSIYDEFAINPSIRVPSSMLRPLEAHETADDRKNLSLRSQDGSIHADIWLLGSQTKPGRRTTIALTSICGSVSAKVRNVDMAPFVLSATAPQGSVALEIPRAFTGLLVLTTRQGSVRLSGALLQNATRLSQHCDSRRYFIGDFSLFGEVWDGDRIEVETAHGLIRLRYVDEGLFSRLFGL